MNLLEQLEQFGHIVIMDKLEGDYAITTDRIVPVNGILDKELGRWNYHVVYNKKYDNWTVDFNIYGRVTHE